MSIIIFANNASALMGSSVAPTDTTVTLQPGQGALFPNLSAGQIMKITFEDTSGNIEVVHATGVTGDVLTIVRAQEGTTALAFASGSRVELRCTAGDLGAMLQKNGGDTLSGTTNLGGVLALGSGGSIQGGEHANGALRGNPGETDNQIVVPPGGGAPTAGGSPILTTANIAANLPSGLDFAHTNMIVYWNGTSSSVPSGWHICDGTNGTPDLRDRFVLGAGGSQATSGGSISTPFVTGSTDALSGVSIGATTLTIAQMPSHTHEFLVSPAVGYASTANPPFTVPMWSSSSAPTYTTNVPAGFSGGAGSQINQSTGGGGSHTHSFSGSGVHTHTYTPPYQALFAIMKL